MNKLANIYEKVVGLLKNNLNNLIFYFLVSMIFYGIFAKLNFTPDTYAFTYNSWFDSFTTFISSGRIFTAIAMMVFKNVPGMTVKIACFISFVVAIIMLVVALNVLDNLIKKIIKNNWLRRLVTIAIIINPFLLELFLFIEKGIMVSGICFSVVAANYFTKYLIDNEQKKENLPKNKNNLIKSAIFLLMAFFCYQGTVGIYVVIVSIFAIKYSKSFASFCKNLLKAAAIYLFAALIDALIVKIFSVSDRTSGNSVDILGSIQVIANSLPELTHMYGLYPLKLQIILSILVIFISSIVIVRFNNKPIREMMMYLFSVVFIYAVTLFAAVAPYLAMNTRYIWVVARSSYVYGSLFGELVLVSMIYIKMNVGKKYIKTIEYLMMTILFVSLGVLFYRVNSIEIDHYNVIALDRQRIVEIESIFNEYENKTGNEIEEVSFMGDSGEDVVTYPYVYNIKDINNSAFRTSWSDITALNYWGTKEYTKINDYPEEFSRYCLSHDWHEFDEEQIIFDGNWAGICIWNQYAE